jgi:hypothetical protein
VQNIKKEMEGTIRIEENESFFVSKNYSKQE